MASNTDIFKSISTLHGETLEIQLNENFQCSLDGFRKATSRIRYINNEAYPAIYLLASDFGGLTITFGDNKKLQLIINLEFYYVYGFLIGNDVYGFQGEGISGLEKLGFDVTPISYGDGYSDIRRQSQKEHLPDVTTMNVRLSTLLTSMENIINPDISFDQKSNDILVTFWSLVEGIRFAKISNTIEDLIENQPVSAIYDDFYKLAVIWAKLSVTAADKGVLNPDIAVYELHRIHRHTGELKS
ncbi:ribosome-inactivating family protein [uncultured Dokdonia sp.]|uniref:ribosome-inactivating family protein n=1 Tax=uncultured Dokdonia sp. TaxID=575653 RepID=UPI00260F10F8|nr:ribosome-inactivating family protein [uncultured Dokdonia sp.]